MTGTRVHRRTLLCGLFQGAAAAMALPLLDRFLDGNGTALADGRPLPVRFGTFFWGCGLTRQLFLPSSTGADYEDMPQLAALKPWKAKLNLLSGFRAFVESGPAIPHWSGNAAIATGIAPTQDGRFAGPTLDQTIADSIGRASRFRSIEIACSGDRRESYSSSGGVAVNPPEVSPLGLYTRLFGPGFQQAGDFRPDPRLMLQQSVLSVVADDRKRLLAEAGAADRARLEQFFTSVREVENTLAVELQKPQIAAAVTIPPRPEAMTVNKSVPVLLKTVPLFSQLLAIGLATDQSRIFNLALSEPADTMFMPGEARIFHQATHEEAVDPALGYQPAVSRYGTHAMECFAALLAALDGVREGDATLLDHCLVLAYTDTSDARLHAVDGIPMFLAGAAGGRLKTGLHIAGHGDTVSRAGLTAQQAMGLGVDRWGAGANQTARPIGELLA
jgi:hypothetical protein